MAIKAEQVDEFINIELSKHFFWEFCCYHDPIFFYERPFLKQVAEAMQWVFNEYMKGSAKSISISLPPRAGKSYITSLFCAWWLGKLPQLSVMRNSSTAGLYNKLSYDTRKIVKSDSFRTVFPDIELAGDKQNVAGWNLLQSKQVGYFGAGTGGTIIGFGANLAVYDDLYRGIEDALNEAQNQKTITWKGADHNSRKEKDCPEIGIGTRWRLNDTIGNEIEKGNVDRIFRISALEKIEVSEQYPLGLKSFCENVNKTEFYLKEKRDLDDAIFNAMYMQEPVELKGLMFPLSSLNLYNAKDTKVEEQSIYRLGVIDPAKGGGDDYAFPAGYLIGDKIYIHDVIYNNEGSDINEVDSVNFIKRNQLNSVRFEGNSAWFHMGKAIRTALQKEKSNCELRIIDNTENKHTRILAQSAHIRNHFLFRDDWESLPQYRKFMKNLTQYLKVGGNAHDDAPDACAELMSFFRAQYSKLW